MSGISSYKKKELQKNLLQLKQLSKTSQDDSKKIQEYNEAYKILSKLICEITGWKVLEGWVDQVVKQVLNNEHVNIEDLNNNINIWKKTKTELFSNNEEK